MPAMKTPGARASPVDTELGSAFITNKFPLPDERQAAAVFARALRVWHIFVLVIDKGVESLIQFTALVGAVEKNRRVEI